MTSIDLFFKNKLTLALALIIFLFVLSSSCNFNSSNAHQGSTQDSAKDATIANEKLINELPKNSEGWTLKLCKIIELRSIGKILLKEEEKDPHPEISFPHDDTKVKLSIYKFNINNGTSSKWESIFSKEIDDVFIDTTLGIKSISDENLCLVVMFYNLGGAHAMDKGVLLKIDNKGLVEMISTNYAEDLSIGNERIKILNETDNNILEYSINNGIVLKDLKPIDKKGFFNVYNTNTLDYIGR